MGHLRIAILAFVCLFATTGCALQFDNDVVWGIGYESRTRVYFFHEVDDHDEDAAGKLTLDKDMLPNEEVKDSDQLPVDDGE